MQKFSTELKYFKLFFFKTWNELSHHINVNTRPIVIALPLYEACMFTLMSKWLDKFSVLH